MKNNNRTTMKATMKNKNEKKTIVQQSYNIPSTMKNNETHEWNTTMEHNNEKQHITTAMTLSNEKQQPYSNETNNDKQEWKKNRTTIIQ